jgi:ABC-type uncharacterized transport system ATPase subunit
MISFSKISKQYGRQVLFVDASFQLNPDEKVGLVGPNGSGKTTLVRMLLGLVFATEGDDLVFYYRQYQRLMDHWRAVLPAERFLEEASIRPKTRACYTSSDRACRPTFADRYLDEVDRPLLGEHVSIGHRQIWR